MSIEIDVLNGDASWQRTEPLHNAVFGVLSQITESHGHIGMCLDSGHANLHVGTRNDYVRFVDLLGDHVPITHWHAHENWGDRDAHLPLFTGPTALDDRGLRGLVRRLRARGFAGSVSTFVRSRRMCTSTRRPSPK